MDFILFRGLIHDRLRVCFAQYLPCYGGYLVSNFMCNNYELTKIELNISTKVVTGIETKNE